MRDIAQRGALHPATARADIHRAAAMRLRLRRDQHHVQLAVQLGRASDALLETLAVGTTFTNADTAADAELRRRGALECPYRAHVAENPYDGKVYCRGCGCLLATLGPGEFL